jgi:adenosylcobinamide-GDP ribazoletransferase
VAVVATGTLAKRKIGGISGDVLGATEQVAEILCLVVLTAQAV